MYDNCTPAMQALCMNAIDTSYINDAFVLSSLLKEMELK
jgi:hypothetical protein